MTAQCSLCILPPLVEAICSLGLLSLGVRLPLGCLGDVLSLSLGVDDSFHWNHITPSNSWLIVRY